MLLSVFTMNFGDKDFMWGERTMVFFGAPSAPSTAPSEGGDGVEENLRGEAQVERRGLQDALDISDSSGEALRMLRGIVELFELESVDHFVGEDRNFDIANNRILVVKIRDAFSNFNIDNLEAFLGGDYLEGIKERDARLIVAEALAAFSLMKVENEWREYPNPPESGDVRYELEFDQRGNVSVNWLGRGDAETLDEDESSEGDQEQSPEEGGEVSESEQQRIEELRNSPLHTVLGWMGLVDENDPESYRNVVNGKNLLATVVLGIFGYDRLTGGSFGKVLGRMSPGIRDQFQSFIAPVRDIAQRGAEALGVSFEQEVGTDEFMNLIGRDGENMPGAGVKLTENVDLAQRQLSLEPYETDARITVPKGGVLRISDGSTLVGGEEESKSYSLNRTILIQGEIPEGTFFKGVVFEWPEGDSEAVAERSSDSDEVATGDDSSSSEERVEVSRENVETLARNLDADKEIIDGKVDEIASTRSDYPALFRGAFDRKINGVRRELDGTFTTISGHLDSGEYSQAKNVFSQKMGQAISEIDGNLNDPRIEESTKAKMSELKDELSRIQRERTPEFNRLVSEMSVV